MIKCENYKVMNFDRAIHGARNPLESWNLSDSEYGCNEDTLCNSCQYDDETFCGTDNLIIGKNDMKLLQKLVKAGSDERKFMRQIFVTVDITSPIYWWKEMDTYKIGTVANSCSTMHKLASTPITRECFSFDEDLDCIDSLGQVGTLVGKVQYNTTFSYSIDTVIRICEGLRKSFLETNDKRYWRALIQLLPESWNQKRTWTANYEVLRNIYFARRNHRLEEWREFCKWIETLSYGKELICLEEHIV